jgi:hypothetical protein
MKKQYFLVQDKLVPFIGGGSVESIGSTLSVSFDGSFSFNPTTSKSSDILFMQLALGEGPIYRINPNGPQDIEIDDKYIDDLVDFSTNNTRSDIFAVRYSVGTRTQPPMPSFSQEIVTPVRFTTPIVLKSGISLVESVSAPPPTSVLFYPTNDSQGLAPIDSIRVKFNVKELRVDLRGGSEPNILSLAALVHDRDEVADLNNYLAGGGLLINSLVNGTMAADLEIKIPEDKRSASGYRISVVKVSEDVAEEGFIAEVEVTGFDEIRKDIHSYPSTALAGYALKSTDFRTDSIPSITSLVKGLIVDVPSNYNQPILESGEVDWRQIEVPSTGVYAAAANGYRTQKYGSTVLTSTDINIYDGIWDGTYKKDWTENRVWIIRHLLVDVLGIPESAIDKYNFYNVAQYVDAVDPLTGNFVGVDGFADGSFRYKPNGYNTEIISLLLGLPEGTPIKERRFVCGVSITDDVSVLDLITALAGSMRAVFSNTGNKIRLIIDKAETLPVAIFNETNIELNSFKLSGVRSEDIPTGVEVSYIDFNNHFQKETLVLDSAEASELEPTNRISIDAVGCTRKSEALRLAQYHLETARQLKRKIQFNASADASDLEIGDIIAVSHKISGVSYGYGGQIFSNSVSNTSNVWLEHYTSPNITSDIFTSNTNPIVLKVFRQDSNQLDYYLVSNTSYNLITTSNSSSGADVIDLNILQKFNPVSKTFQANTLFSAVTAPTRGDLWALGEINPTAIYNDTSTKLFRVESLSFNPEGTVGIVATEYNSGLLANVDSASKDVTTQRKSSFNYITPPPPVLSLRSIPSKTNEGIVSYNLLLSSTSDTSNYPVSVTTTLSYGTVENIVEIEGFEEL